MQAGNFGFIDTFRETIETLLGNLTTGKGRAIQIDINNLLDDDFYLRKTI